MVTACELEHVRRRVDRLEVELAETRRLLAGLERRVSAEATPAAVAIVPPPALSVELATKAERAVPPPLPPLPVVPQAPAVSRAGAEVAVPPELPPPRFVAAPVAEVPAAAAPLRLWLERLQLWPPAADGEEGAEARLGAWWATRVGTLLAVVGVVFFGIYVSRHTPAWVKFLELLAVSAGVSALGLWLERRLAAFGQVVFAGGLALGFFAAYAGHAVPAVKVFPELWMSVVAQGLAVAGIVAASLWRRSSLVATLAVGLGYVTAIVSGRGGMEGCALGAGALLAVVAVAFRRGRAWEGPSVVALPGAYAVFALGLYQAWASGAQSLPAATWPYLIGVAVLFFVRDWRGGEREPKPAPLEELWFQGLNSSLALACGLWAVLGWSRAELRWFYAGAALLLALGAWRRAIQSGRRDPVAVMLLAKAAGALTLAVIEFAGARDAAIALLVQAWVLAWTARRLESRVLAGAAGLVVLVATSFFALHGLAAAPIWSATAAKAVLFTFGVAMLASEGGRWLLPDDREARRVVEATGATIAALGLLVAISRWTPPHWEPVLALGLAGLFGAAAWARKASAPGWAALALAAAAQVWLWVSATTEPVPANLGWNAFAVCGALAAVGLVTRSRAVSGAAWALAVTGAVLTLFALCPADRALLLGTVTGVLFGVAAAWASGRHLGWVATLAVVLAGACWFGRGLDGDALLLVLASIHAWALPAWLRGSRRADEERRTEPLNETMERMQALVATVVGLRALTECFDGAQLGLAFALAGLATFALALRPGVRSALASSLIFWIACVLGAAFGHGGGAWWISAGLLAWVPALVWVRAPAEWLVEFTGWRRHAPAWQVAVASVLAMTVALEVLSGAAGVFALCAAGLVAALVARPGGVEAARYAAGVLGASLIWTVLGRIAAGQAEGWGAGFLAVLAAAVTLSLLPLWLTERRGEAGRLARLGGGGAALAVMLIVFGAQRGELAPYATVGWGVSAIALFMGGLFGRTAPYRVLGLLGLGLCLPRMFLVDLDSALHRIVAFLVVGVVLMWVGFSYHRFKHLVSDRDPRPESSPKK